jgi:hypothetical protein
MEETNELEDSQKPQNETSDDSENIAEEETSDLSIEEKVAKLEEANKKLFARTKKAETELKALKESPKEQKAPAEIKPEIKQKENDLSVVDQRLDERLEERDLESLELSDEAKKDIKSYAKAAGLKIKQVAKTDYFKFVKDKEEAAKKVEEASIGRKRGAPTTKDFASTKPTEFDLSTEEGRKEYEEYKDWRKKRS